MRDIEKARIQRAIIQIHHNSEYMKGMDLLCKMVGWKSIVNFYDSPLEQRKTEARFNEWVQDQKRSLPKMKAEYPVQKGFRVSIELDIKIKKVSEKLGISQMELMRQAVEEFIERKEKK